MDTEPSSENPVALVQLPVPALSPITRIGIETELSRYPIHNLAKKGRVDIQITRKKPDGQIDLRWEVSYSERYGQARQLAYKLDTIVINRRIDEEGRPIPKILQLGSLRDLAEKLDLGGNTNKVRKALRQNVGTVISAKFRYKSVDGTERTLEADFTRYSVVFTGEKLPDGREADAVYLILNDPYREVLNNAPIRPLNYDYLKVLPPSAQRFYEIISARVFATLKNKNPFAKILYSDFCIYSALTRHFDYENFRVQMAKIHRPHLKSGYITKIHYDQTTDEQGRLDWMMSYEPGSKARSEYYAFTKKKAPLNDAIFESEKTCRVGESTRQVSKTPATVAPGFPEQRSENPLLAEFTRRGIAEKRARALLRNLTEGQQVVDQLEWGDYLVSQSPGGFRNPPGFLISLIEQNVTVPENFETSRQRKVREQFRQAEEKRIQEQLAAETAYDEYKRRETDRYIKEHLTDFELEQLQKDKRKQLTAQFKNFALMPVETVNQVVWGAVRAEVAKRVPFLAFKSYCEERSRQPSLFPENQEQGHVPPARNIG